MALFTPSESPAVVVREIDLTGGVPNVQSTTGAVVGNFRWGPVEQRTAIANEAELVNVFASPSDSNSVDFLTANQFLRYSSSLQVIRTVDSSAVNSCISSATAPTIKNRDDFDGQQTTLASTHTFIGKYPGDLGNSLTVSICPADSADTNFTSWAYKTSFDNAPGTSYFASQRSAVNDEAHIIVVDTNGAFSGAPGTVLETFPYVSMGSNAKTLEGSNNYAIDVVNERSEYVWMAAFDSSYTVAGTTIDNGDEFGVNSVITEALGSGANSGALGTSEVLAGFDYFEDKDQVEVDFLISPSMSARSDQTTVVNDLIATARNRKDCVVVASPARTDVINVTSDATKVSNVVSTANTFTNTSRVVIDNNFLKVYDKYNDKYVWIPASSSVAGIMAATDFNRAPWFSPAGSRRGQLLGITGIAYSPTKAQRDTLYKADVNPIANIPGQGTLLFGDKTGIGRPSAFDRINVRRLFLVLERAIGKAAEQVMFEFNDEFMEAIAYYAYEASSDLAKEFGTYSSYKGSKWDRGIMPQDSIDLLEQERGIEIKVPRAGKMDWKPLRERIAKQGMRNSNVLAIAPTATISNIMGTTPCIEPTYKNLFVKSNLSGDFIVLNNSLVKDLKAEGLWNQDMVDQLKYFDGELDSIENIPDHLREKYKTAFTIDYQYFIDAASRRQKWIDQAQSVNLFLPEPDIKVLSHMYRDAWHKGLKTTYYLRTLGASNIEKATVAVKKEMRGRVSDSAASKDTKKEYTEAEKQACSLDAMLNGGECEACQ